MSTLEASLRLEESRTASAEQSLRASELEHRHLEHDRAIQLVRARGTHANILLCTGMQSFVKLTSAQAQRLLQNERNALWQAVDDAHRNLHALENRVERHEELVSVLAQRETERQEDAAR